METWCNDDNLVTKNLSLTSRLPPSLQKVLLFPKGNKGPLTILYIYTHKRLVKSVQKFRVKGWRLKKEVKDGSDE